MNCRFCGAKIPDDSDFCQFCGKMHPAEFTNSDNTFSNDRDGESERGHNDKAEGINQELGSPPDSPVQKERSSETKSEPDNSNSQSTERTQTINDAGKEKKKKVHCKKCGGVIDSRSHICVECGKRYFNPKVGVPIIILSLLCTALLCLSGYLYQQNKELSAKTASQAAAITQRDQRINTINTTLDDLRNQLSAAKLSAGNYDRLIAELKSGNIGSASNNFKASEGIIVVGCSEENRKFTLTTTFSKHCTVDLDYSMPMTAYVEFDNDSWNTSTKMTVHPWQPGVTAVTFSNDVSDQTFKVIIIVVD